MSITEPVTHILTMGTAGTTSGPSAAPYSKIVTIRSWAHNVMDAQNEGVTWIHGHHADDSPEALALLMAYVLTYGQGE